MSGYVPNQGELEMLKDFLLHQAVVLGLYSNPVVPDGSLTVAGLTELATDGGYARIPLINEVVEDAPATGKWYVAPDANGKGSGQFGLAAAPQTWTFNAADVGKTVNGIFGFTLVLPFTAGLQRIKVGDVLRQGAVCAEVTGVQLASGSWAGGDAAGNIYLKRQSGVFAAGATLVNASRATATSEIKVLTAAPVNGGTGYAVGDRFLIGTGTGGVGRVTAISGGVVTAVELLTGGKDYTVATQATTKIDGGGDNALTVAVASLYTAGPAVAIATIAGDSSKKLLFVEPLSAPDPITATGQIVTYLPIISYSTV
jgi:hypothetical protein